MATHLPSINNKSKSISYNYRSLDATFSMKRTTPINKTQSIQRNIDRYYATSDVHDILGHDKDKIPGDYENTIDFDQNQEVSGNLKLLRKQYDQLKSKSNAKEKEIVKMRNEIDQIKIQQNGMYGNKEYYQQKQIDLTAQREEIGGQFQEARMNKKTYEHMIERMKKDLICFKKRVQSTQDELDKGKTVFQSVLERFKKTKQKYNKIEQALVEVQQQKEIDSAQRENNMESFITKVMEKQDLEKQREARIKRQVEIAEIAANDIRDSNLKKWRKLLLVHQFLNTFLKRKMEREMTKYRGVEQAFQRIKASTGISEAGEIVHKFLNREHTYSHLLISIADYETKIANLKRENEVFKAKLGKLKQENAPVDKDSHKANNFELEEITMQYRQILEKSEQSQLLEERLFEWLKKNKMRLERAIDQETAREDYRNLQKKDIPNMFEDITKVLEEHLLQKDAKEVDEAITNFIKKNNQKQMLNLGDSSPQQPNPNSRLQQTQENELLDEFQRRNIRARPPSHRIDTPNDSMHDSKAFTDNTQTKADEDEDDYKEEIGYLKQMRQQFKNNLNNNSGNMESARKSIAVQQLHGHGNNNTLGNSINQYNTSNNQSSVNNTIIGGKKAM